MKAPGPDVVSRGQRDHPADLRLVFLSHRTQELLHGVGRAVYGELVFVRICAEPGWLLFFRVLQGLGGGGLQPSEQSILADTFPTEKLGMAMALYGFAVVTAPVIGRRWAAGSPTTTPGAGFLHQYPGGVYFHFLTSRMVEDPPTLVRRSLKT